LTIAVSPDSLPALVLNADYRPLSYYPLSLWSWQDAIKAVFLDRVNIVAEYDHEVSSPSFAMKVPSVVCLKAYVKPATYPAFTRFNVFLRDKFQCQYCGSEDDLTFDHLVPRRFGGQTTWDNIVTACSPCNLRKGGKMPRESGMNPTRCRSIPPCTTCTTMAEVSRPTTFTKAGWITFTGMSSWSLDRGLRRFCWKPSPG
jgi:5-methylcytosine-specific restriction endonuclease McrA